MDILVIAPHMDVVTSISAELALKFADWAKKNGHNVRVLYGIGATRLPLLLSLMANTDCVYYCGHGDVDMLLGNELLFGLVTSGNANWLKQKITATMACLSLKTLGPKVIENGGYAYVGAKDVLYAAFNEQYPYLEDWLEYMLILPQELVKDFRVVDAVNDLKAKARSYADKYQSQKPDDSWDWYYQSTLHNSEVYSFVGNPDLRLSDLVKAKQEQKPAMNLFEGTAYLFKPDVLGSQWDDARKVLTSFGIIGTFIGGTIASIAVEAIGSHIPEAKKYKEAAGAAGGILGGSAIPI